AAGRGLAHRERPPPLRPTDPAPPAGRPPGQRRTLDLRPRLAHRPSAGPRAVSDGRVEWSPGAAGGARARAGRRDRRAGDVAAGTCRASLVAREPRAIRDGGAAARARVAP